MKKVLMLSIDRDILIAGSDANVRMRSYGAIVRELHVIVFSSKTTDAGGMPIAGNVRAYSTRSWSRLFYVFDAYRIARAILKNAVPGEWLITSQDAFTHPVGVLLRNVFKIALEVQVHTDFMSPYFRRESLMNYARYLIE